MAELIFEVVGNPEPWQVQVRNYGRTEAYRRRVVWQERIRAAAIEYWRVGHGRLPLAGAVRLRFTFYREWPERAPKRLGKAAAGWIQKHLIMKPDVGNYAKAAEDALEGIIYQNDSQVVGTESWKGYPLNTLEGLTVIRFEEVS